MCFVNRSVVHITLIFFMYIVLIDYMLLVLYENAKSSEVTWENGTFHLSWIRVCSYEIGNIAQDKPFFCIIIILFY